MLVFGFFLEEVTVGAETVFTGDGVFERDLPERHQSQSHVGAKEDKAAER